MNVKLNNGYEMPMIGLGTWQLEGNELINSLEESYKLGYRHIDTASCYGNEDIIGGFLKNYKRNEFFITTKLWCDSHENALYAINESLRKLQIDYVDLYLVHWPVNLKGKFDLENVWSQMEELVKLGKTKSIGVANFGVKNLNKLLSFCKIKPVVNQIELHPYLPQYEIRDLCKKNEIQIVSYSSLGSSFDQGVSALDDPILKEIAIKHNCTVHQVILSSLLKEGILIIPRSKSKEHLKTNITTVDIDDEDIENIRSIETRFRFIDPVSFGENRFD